MADVADLQRLLRYGRVDGSMADAPARDIITVTDAIIAGQGEGPLSPTPDPRGPVTLGPAPLRSKDSRGLMGSTTRRIPIVAHAFDPMRFPIAPGRPEAVVVRSSGATLSFEAACRAFGGHFTPPQRLARPLRTRPGSRARGP